MPLCGNVSEPTTESAKTKIYSFFTLYIIDPRLKNDTTDNIQSTNVHHLRDGCTGPSSLLKLMKLKFHIEVRQSYFTGCGRLVTMVPMVSGNDSFLNRQKFTDALEIREEEIHVN